MVEIISTISIIEFSINNLYLLILFNKTHSEKSLFYLCNIFVQSCFLDNKKKSNVEKMKVIYLMLRTQRHNGDMMRNVYLYDF